MHLVDVAGFRMGKTPARAQPRYWDDGRYPWVSIADMTPYGRVLATKERVSESAHTDVFRGAIVPRGSMIMSFKLTIGRVSKLGMDAYHNEAIISLQADPGLVDEDFLFFALGRTDYSLYQDTAIKGQTLNKAKLASVEIALPPLEEQRRIGAGLRAIRDVLDTLDESIRITSQLKAAILNRFLSDDRHGSVHTEIGDVPADWRVARLAEVAALGTGTTPSTARAEYYVGDVPFIKTTDITNNRISSANTHISHQAVKDYNLKLYPAGSVLLAMYGQGKTRGQVALLEIAATTTQNAAAIQPGDEIIGEYLWLHLMSRYDELRGTGALGHISHLNLGYMKDFPVVVPPVEVQKAIVAAMGALEERIEALRRKRSVIEDLFLSLSTDLLAGRLRLEAGGTAVEDAAAAAVS